MIILDLEWNRGYDLTPLEEILQIGAVRMDRLDGGITDTFNAYIRPRVHRKFNPTTKALPDFESSLASELDFATAYAAFRAWCGDERIFAEWGRDDLKVLKANCEYWKLPPLEPEKACDFQWAFSSLLDPGRQLRLCDAVEYLKIPAPFCYHNALNDALYAAMVGAWLGDALAFVEKPPKVKKRRTRKRRWSFAQAVFPPQPRHRVGPFETVDTVLNARASRKPSCPVCRKRDTVHLWYFAQPGVYYSPFRCPEHGRFLCRLTLAQLEDGRWRGRLAVPAITPELLREFDRAADGSVHNCKMTGRRKRKKRRRRRKPAVGRET